MRVLERILSLLLALAVVAGAIVLALEVGWAVAGKAPLLIDWRPAYTNGTRHAWDNAIVRVTAVVVLVVGLLLLVAELKPRRVTRLQMTSTDPTVDAAITRRSLRSSLLARARQVDGISDARATVGKRTVTVHATSRLGSAETAQSLTQELETALRGRLDDLQLARTPKLRTRVAARRGARST